MFQTLTLTLIMQPVQISIAPITSAVEPRMDTRQILRARQVLGEATCVTCLSRLSN